ncbi:alpha-D-glucose phosphate-specific phosphoglucomutase [Cardiobacteriaceae bacterium TAE3-ERU3]|nr:alpha-D-glucose phosphate-specific phosphoglucomutase [Cardiobacteriaceae bacterium TAE3-ERU3]
MKTQHISTTPFTDQRPGTSGLRKPVQHFRQPNYSENFLQAVFDTLGIHGKTIVIGGDGRFFNSTVIKAAIRMAVAQGAHKLIVAQNGLLSTPAASHLIRTHQADYGIILSASHNPGGEDGDFGIKVNLQSGEPAPESITEAIYQTACKTTGYTICDSEIADIADCGQYTLGMTEVSIVSSTDDYLKLMQQCFDFPAIKAWLAQHDMAFDALHAVTGPYATAIFCDALGISRDHILSAEPQTDFGGHHPDPAPDRVSDLRQLMKSNDQIVLGAASDGDGDRNLICGQKYIINPCDSLAIIAANHQHIPCLQKLTGVARSMPTSRAIDKVAEHLGVSCYETPTGWKFFASLLDAGLIQLCGEESFGTGGAHIREKDGIWAILCWLNILAATDSTPDQLLEAHWAQYGRHHFNRYDYTALDRDAAQAMLAKLEKDLPKYIGQTHHGLTITTAGQFNYTDPVNGEKSPGQGLQIKFGQQARIILRLSGTDTRGVTLRIYCEYWQQDAHKTPALFGTTATLASFAQGLLNLSHFCDRTQPDHII